jgi:hypothetical protein
MSHVFFFGMPVTYQVCSDRQQASKKKKKDNTYGIGRNYTDFI